MGEVKLTEAQNAILAFMIEHDLRFIAYYDGPPGAEGNGAGFFWKQFPRGIKKPNLDGRTVNGLIKKNFLAWAGYGDCEITPAGRAMLEGKGSGE